MLQMIGEHIRSRQNKIREFVKLRKNVNYYYSRIMWLISISLRSIMGLIAIRAVFSQKYVMLFLSLLALFLTFLPMMIHRTVKIRLPIEFEFVITIFLFTTLILGELSKFYDKFWWWDTMLHTGSAIVLGFCGFLILYNLYYKGMLKASPLTIVIFSFSFAVCIGALWEIVEFSLDNTAGLNLQRSSLLDTMQDLINDCMGALISSFTGYLYIKKTDKKPKLFDHIIKQFIIHNPHIFKIDKQESIISETKFR